MNNNISNFHFKRTGPGVTKAMLLAAGFGTRLQPFTNRHPKALAQVHGKTLLEHNIKYLQQFGIFDVIVNVHHFADQIIQTIRQHNGWGSNVSFSDETDAILETGGGLKRAAWFFEKENNFVLMNIDVLTDLTLDAMITYHVEHNPLATLATTNRETSRYFLFDKNNFLCGWRNVKTGEEKIICQQEAIMKAFSGIHIINTNFFSLITQTEKKFSMVDVYLLLCSEHKILSYDHSHTKFIDVGKPESLQQAAMLFNSDF